MLEVKTQTQHLLADVRNTNEIFNFMIENILASSSPRRKTLLNQIGFNYEEINNILGNNWFNFYKNIN